MSILFSKKNTVTLIGTIIFCSSLLIGCGNKMPGKVYKINEINYSKDGEKTTENHGFQEYEKSDFSYHSDDKAEYDTNGKLIRNAFFANTYDVFGNLISYDYGMDDRIASDSTKASFNVKYNKKAKKITVTNLEKKSNPKTAIYKYDDSGKLVYYKVSNYKNSDIWLQYDYSLNTGKIDRITYYSKLDGETDPRLGIARWIFQWDYFSTFNFNNYK